jgi:urea carboxylase-associated protein 2
MLPTEKPYLLDALPHRNRCCADRDDSFSMDSYAREVVSMESSVLLSEVLPGGATWSHVLKRGTALRITDVDGGANIAAYFLNFELPAERFNLPDTLKAQHTARLTKGHVLYSDMGRILCSITEDTVGWHDPIAGLSNAALMQKKYGQATYQQMHNSWHQNARDGLSVELCKYGLSARDLHATVNFFSKVTVDAAGDLQYCHSNSVAGSYVELRAEMNVLVLLNSCPHPMDTDNAYAPKPVTLSIAKVPAPRTDDACRMLCRENMRGFLLTEFYFF